MTGVSARPGFWRMIGRAVLLRCPRCGGRGIKRGLGQLQPRCPACGLVTNRGESEDYWLGGYTINFIAAEFIAVFLIVGLILVMWPAVNWGLVTSVGAVAAVAMPILFFPFSRTLWLALDL